MISQGERRGALLKVQARRQEAYQLESGAAASTDIYAGTQLWSSLDQFAARPDDAGCADSVTATVCMVQVPWPQQTLRRLLEGKPTISSHLDATECESQSQETQLSHQQPASGAMQTQTWDRASSSPRLQ